MTVTLPNADAAATGAKTFQSLNPATGAVVGTHPAHTVDEVNEIVRKARAAAAFWADLSCTERGERLRAFNGLLISRRDELAELMRLEVGKPVSDAKAEIALINGHVDWAAKHAGKVLGRRTVASGPLLVNQRATLEYQPLGVVGVIGPWNYPVFTPLGSIAFALAAGNAVVFKPSEYSPGVGEWLAARFAEVVPEAPVFSVVTGFSETGAALCRSGVDKIAFTGSTKTAKIVMRTCAENLVPLVVEAGGKDAALVDEDADLKAAAEAVAWGAMSNAGQTCIGIERVYVHEKAYEAFLAELKTQLDGVTAGSDDEAKIGPITMPSQVGVIRGHIEDALAKGGKAFIGGPGAVGERFIQPTVLTDVPEHSSAVCEETFGPTVTVTKVPDMDEAVRRANAPGFGLGGAVFSKRQGYELARRIRSGMVSVNSVLTFATISTLPFGGVGQSGFGRIHGEDGLREFAAPKAITEQRFKPLLALLTFSRTPFADKAVGVLGGLLYGRVKPAR